MSHPSSSTSFGGVYPKAAHTGLLPCKGVKGTVLCPAIWGAPSSSQDQKHSSVVARRLLLLSGKAEPILGQRYSSSRRRHLALGPVLSESYQRHSWKSQFSNEWRMSGSFLQEVSSGVWYTGFGEAMTTKEWEKSGVQVSARYGSQDRVGQGRNVSQKCHQM